MDRLRDRWRSAGAARRTSAVCRPERGEFPWLYQPQLELNGGRVKGVEALLCW